LVKGGGKKYPGGVGVKVGEIGSQEVEAIRRSGELGVGPRLIAARVSKINREDSDYPEGAIAMSKVPGRRLREIPGGIEGGTSGRAVMEAVSLLHKTGVSHNDLHDGNIFVDKDGKVHLVDFGMARISPKYALAEAMRQFGSQGNLEDVRQRLLALGVTKREASRMQVSFGDYVSGGGWDKISDKQAMSLINTFYREAI
jgi:predicted Ser/Thr protein kinase